MNSVHPCKQRGTTLAIRWREIERSGGPAIQRLARHVIPREPLPGSEIQLPQPRIEPDRTATRQRSGERGTAARRAGPDRRRPEPGQRRDNARNRRKPARRQPDIEPAIADPGRDLGGGMTHQGYGKGA